MAEHDAPHHAVAVVLAPPGSEQVAVRAVTAERSWRVLAVSDPMLALVEIALAERAAKTRAAWDKTEQTHPGERGERGEERSDHSSSALSANSAVSEEVSFVLAHPQRWAMRQELLEAITRYFPDTRLFAFDERGLQEGRRSGRARGSELRAQKSEVSGQTSATAEKRLNVERSSSEAAPRTSKPFEPAISRDEIEMLLGGEAR